MPRLVPKMTVIGFCVALGAVLPALAQPQPAVLPPDQVDGLVSRVALYPDPLLAQIFTAATYSGDIPDAARWADEHRYVTGDQLARAINDDRLPWAPSVIALLPFPQVLGMMASDMRWTTDLGNAVLSQRYVLMDAVQRLRQNAVDSGYLRDSAEERVVMNEPGSIEILPVQAGYYYVPTYDPGYLLRWRPGSRIRASIGFGFGPRVFIGSAFSPWGWSGPRVDWRAHNVIIDRQPWQRSWDNREAYRHPYATERPRYEGPRIERHERDLRRSGDRRNSDRDRRDRR